MGRQNRKFLGAERAQSTPPETQPSTPEDPIETIHPRLASKDKKRRREATKELRGFWDRYREAWKEYRAGNRNVVFPPGTYLMRVYHGVRCAPFPGVT